MNLEHKSWTAKVGFGQNTADSDSPWRRLEMGPAMPMRSVCIPKGAAALFALLASVACQRSELTNANRPGLPTTGEYSLRQTWAVNFKGKPVRAPRDVDLWFEARSMERRFLTPRNGTLLARAGRNAPGLEGCRARSLSSGSIPLDQLAPGEWLCVRTRDGQYGQLQVLGPIVPGLDAVLKLSYFFWNG
jgi:hypothetical protein